MEVELATTQTFINQLSADRDLCESRLVNAASLIDLLRDEGKRWEQSIETMEQQDVYTVGDVFLAAAELSYLGPFDQKYREKLVQKWQELCVEHGIEVNSKYSLVATLGDPV